MNATITGNQLVLSSDTATVATAETFALTFVPDWVYPEIYVRAEQDDTRVEILVSEGSAVVPLGVGTWDISVVGRKNGTDLVTNKVKLYVDRLDIHHVPLDIQELYKPLIAPLSVSLTGFVEGSYLYYGIPWDTELRVFIKVSKSTAMSGTTAIGTLPSGYRPDTAQTLTAYGEDGNILSDVTVTIGTDGAVAVVGSVDANAVILASYNSSSNSGGLTYKDIDKLVAAKFADTGWVEVPSAWYATDIAAYTSPLKYRKIGNTVHFYGNLKTTVQQNAKTTYNAITLPTALNPVQTRQIPQVNGNFDSCVALVESGVIRWFNTVVLGAGGSMRFHLSYLTD